jgi:hypothetical protein
MPALPTSAPGLGEAVIEHRAVLILPNGTSFIEVIETYKADVWAFALPLRP